MAFSFPWRLYGGALRPDAITGLQSPFSTALVNMYNAAPENVRNYLGLTSAYRSKAVQAALYNASDRSGRTVAAPGHSRHNYGMAADLYGFGLKGGAQVPQYVKDWVHANAGAYGLNFPMHYEPWHIQMGRSWRGGDPAATAVNIPANAQALNTTTPSAATAKAAPGDVGGLARGSIMAAQPNAVVGGGDGGATITPDGTPPTDPVEAQLTGADKQKPLGGLMGELAKGVGGDKMQPMELKQPSAGQPGTSLADLIQQWITTQMKSYQPQQAQQPPPLGGSNLG